MKKLYFVHRPEFMSVLRTLGNSPSVSNLHLTFSNVYCCARVLANALIPRRSMSNPQSRIPRRFMSNIPGNKEKHFELLPIFSNSSLISYCCVLAIARIPRRSMSNPNEPFQGDLCPTPMNHFKEIYVQPTW